MVIQRLFLITFIIFLCHPLLWAAKDDLTTISSELEVTRVRLGITAENVGEAVVGFATAGEREKVKEALNLSAQAYKGKMQDLVNKATLAASTAKKLSVLGFLLSHDGLGFDVPSPDQVTIDIVFGTALHDGDGRSFNTMLLHPLFKTKPTQAQVDGILCEVAEQNNLPGLKMVETSFECGNLMFTPYGLEQAAIQGARKGNVEFFEAYFQVLPLFILKTIAAADIISSLESTEGVKKSCTMVVNKAAAEAAKFGHIELIRFFFSHPYDDALIPNEEGLQKVLGAATQAGHYEIINLLFPIIYQENPHFNAAEAIKEMLWGAALGGYYVFVANLMFHDIKGIPHPTQLDVDKALEGTINAKDPSIEICEILLTHQDPDTHDVPEFHKVRDLPKADPKLVGVLYDKALKGGKKKVISFLMPQAFQCLKVLDAAEAIRWTLLWGAESNDLDFVNQALGHTYEGIPHPIQDDVDGALKVAATFGYQEVIAHLFEHIHPSAPHPTKQALADAFINIRTSNKIAEAAKDALLVKLAPYYMRF